MPLNEWGFYDLLDSPEPTSALPHSLNNMSNQQLYDPYGYDQCQSPWSPQRPTTSSWRGPSQQGGMPSRPYQIGRISSHETQPWGPAIPTGPPLPNRPPRQGTYGLQTQTMTHGPVQRMLYPPPTLTGPSEHGTMTPNTRGSDNGTSPSRYWTPPTSPNPSTCPHLTSHEWHWGHQEPAPRYFVPDY